MCGQPQHRACWAVERPCELSTMSRPRSTFIQVCRTSADASTIEHRIGRWRLSRGFLEIPLKANGLQSTAAFSGTGTISGSGSGSEKSMHSATTSIGMGVASTIRSCQAKTAALIRPSVRELAARPRGARTTKTRRCPRPEPTAPSSRGLRPTVPGAAAAAAARRGRP